MAIHASCFKRMFQVFYLFSVAYCKCFSTGCFKSRSRGAHVAMAPVACGQRPAIAACYCCWGAARGSPRGLLRPADTSRHASAGRVRRERLSVTVHRGNGPPVTRARQARAHAFYAKHVLGNDNILMSGGCGTCVHRGGATTRAS
jgi:hypothetical protein